MRRSFWLFLALLGLAVVVIVGLARHHRARGQRALEQCKAELRAKGEKLTWAELGFPRAPEQNEDFARFLAAAARLRSGNPARIAGSARSYVAAGRARVAWAAERIGSTGPGLSGSNTLSWAELETELDGSADLLAGIRRALENPPARWAANPTNLPSPARPDFVRLRDAAQWLAEDCLVALHANQQTRARADLHALAQLTQVHRDDPSLVCQMIRVAITGLALPVTWEALQAGGWTEADLAAMQRDWEKLSLSQCVELGMVGERAFVEHAVTRLREGSIKSLDELFNPMVTRPKSAEDYFGQLVILPLWRANAANDELYHLKYSQKTLELLRQLDKGRPWLEAKAEFGLLTGEVERLARGLGRYRHLVSLVALPNVARATETTVRRETERRLTVVALALKRYELRHSRAAASLQALVPEFLTAVPLDPMNGKPLVYRLSTDGAFVLYSVGEDGQDDGGDPRPATPKAPDLWSGRDAVWPAAVFDTNAPAGDNAVGASSLR